MKYETFDGEVTEISPDVVEKAKLIRFIAFDFDGVFTDGMVYTDQNGIESVRCSRRDGLALVDMIPPSGIHAYIISKEKNPVVEARAKKMKTPYFQGVPGASDKLAIFKEAVEKEGCTLAEAAYMGDDLNDLHTLEAAGLSVAVQDAHPRVRKSVDLITSARGGHHAVRELVEIILLAQGKDPAELVEQHNHPDSR